MGCLTTESGYISIVISSSRNMKGDQIGTSRKRYLQKAQPCSADGVLLMLLFWY